MTKFDPTKPVQTRNGRKAEIIPCDGFKGDDGETIIARVWESRGHQEITCYYDSGLFSRGHTSCIDLINIPEKPKTIERWVNVYKDNKVGGLHGEKPRSDLIAGSIGGPRVACVPVTITFTPGEGLDDD